jgi:hypothetical protein
MASFMGGNPRIACRRPKLSLVDSPFVRVASTLDRVTAVLFLLVASLLVFPSSSLAQGVQTGTITGTVRDAGGLVLPGVTVTVSSPALQGNRTAVTDANGVYVVRALPPGRYTVAIELDGFARQETSAMVDLGAPSIVDAALQPAGLQETVTVSAPVASALTTTHGGANYRNVEIDALATPRTLSGIAELAPGLTDNTPNTRQVTISGAFAYDNVFLVDGVDVSDNLFGDPNSLFIEDAIEETQVLTSGVPAEYGRFSGGVVNAITKRGGDIFSGSFRTNLTNPAWTDETPFEQEQGTERESVLSKVFEGTMGGPVLRSRLWFFGAGRYTDQAESVALNITGLQLNETQENKRYEIKLTGTAASAHTFQGSYLNNDTKSFERVFDFSIDTRAVNSPHIPNDLTAINYKGVLSSKLLVEAQFSQKDYRFEGAGGTLTDIHESPFITQTPELGLYNAPYFDATDPEDRNNRQVTGSLAYFLTTPRTGSHDIKGGFEWYRSINTGGNSQSPTSYVFFADHLTDVEGEPVFNSDGRLIPVFSPFNTFVNNWQATRGAELDITTTSFYVHDRWSANRHWSFDLGLRYERVRSEATGGILGIDTDTFVPRLAASFDPTGDGQWVVQATYAHYAGKYSEAQFSANTNVGNPDLVQLLYVGPEGQGLDFEPGFDIANNYVAVNGEFARENVLFEDGLSSPTTREFTLSAGRSLGSHGYAKASYIWRDVSDFVEDFSDLTTGSTTVERDGVAYGPFVNKIYRNTDLPIRSYQALQFSGRYRLLDAWSVNGHWTVQLENEGNFEGEATNQPALSSVIGDQPELFNEVRHYPIGTLAGFQHHKIRLWTIYNLGLDRLGSVDLSAMWRYDSGQTGSFVELGAPLTEVQEQIGAIYPSLPPEQTVFFGRRGAIQFDGAHVFDLAATYQIPLFRSLRPWLKAEVRNVFNNDTLTSYNTAVVGDFDGPLDELGLPMNFIRDPGFGKADGNGDFPIPRTFLVAVGFRF